MGNTVKSPFDVLNAMFDLSSKTFNTLTNKDKERNFFIINRRMSIGFPNIAFGLSKMNINPIYAIDFWHFYIKSKKMSKPAWIYMKSEKVVVDKKIKYTTEARDFYLKENEITEREFNDAIKFNFDKMQEQLKIIDNYLKLLKK